MRLLSDSPNMAFLRQEAKDLLGVLRQSDVEATLTFAQRRLAEEYGFRSWSELKAEVERRRGDAPEPPEGLAEAVAAEFGLGSLRSISAVTYEYMGRRWDLTTDQGRFIVRPVFDWIDNNQAEIAVDLQERARRAGVHSPTPVRTTEGRLVFRTDDQNWRVEQWLDLGPRPVEPIDPDVAEQVGFVLAAVHRVAPKTDRPIRGEWVSPDARPTNESWQALIDHARTTQASWVDQLSALAPTIEDLSGVTAEPTSDDVVITNCDIGVTGVRLGAGGGLVIMHWDFTGPMTPEWELATTLFHWSGEGTNLAAAQALIAGYRQSQDRVPALSLGSFSSVITGWLTWVLHRAWEATDPEPSEKRDFGQRSLKEVLDDPMTQLSPSGWCPGRHPPDA